MRRICGVLCATALWACAAAVPPARKPALDPSNPDGPESKPLPISTALAPDPPVADEAKERSPSGHQHGAAQQGEHGSADLGEVEFTCPMHPEMSQPGPGRCPKCGMPLVPRKQNARPGSPGEADSPQHEHQQPDGERR